MARTKKKHARKSPVVVYLTAEEKETLRQIADVEDITMSDYMRSLFLDELTTGTVSV